MQLGVIGLSTMGGNLARNAARNGATVAIYNRTSEKTDEFLKAYKSEGMFVPCKSYDYIVAALKPPRPILMMVKAGEAVDQVINDLVPLLSRGDILIDGGNSHFRDTDRREKELAKKGIRFMGMGVSGGEEGALKGPSMMPGGDQSVVDDIMPLLQKMAASDGDGGKCVSYIGPGGAGHFVKMVHNGIEYGLMQLIAETYGMLKTIGGLSNEQLAAVFDEWNQTPELSSFLLEITAKIFARKDSETGKDLIDLIKDAAEQKGTGKWTTEAACDLGQATPTIDAAVSARILSGDPKRDRRDRTKFPQELLEGESAPSADDIKKMAAAALECAMICTYNQGFHLIDRASQTFGWKISMSEVARIWRGGCIIRAGILEKFQRACSSDPSIASSITEGEIVSRFTGGRQGGWRQFVQLASAHGLPIPAMAASLSYFDTIRSERLPQNLIQAQRDFFGAHTYKRIDREGTFHTHWEERPSGG